MKDTRPTSEKLYEMAAMWGSCIFAYGAFTRAPELVIMGLAVMAVSVVIHSRWTFHHPPPHEVPPKTY
jgi:hypothetical protein